MSRPLDDSAYIDEIVLAFFTPGEANNDDASKISYWSGELTEEQVEASLKRLVSSGLLERRRSKKRRTPMGDFADVSLRRLTALELLARQKR